MGRHKADITKKEIIQKFSYKISGVSKRTRIFYIRLAHEILKTNGYPKLTSKSKYFQCRAVVSRLNKAAGTSSTLPTWTECGNKRISKIHSKLISEKEFDVIFNALPNTDLGKELALAARISYFSGLRLHEVLNLKKQQIQISGHIVLNILGKGGKFRKSYLPVSMLSEIQDFTGFNISYIYATEMFRRIASKVLGRKVSFHALRHSYGTRMINSGIPIQELQQYMGHSNITTTAIYLHYKDGVSENLQALGY